LSAYTFRFDLAAVRLAVLHLDYMSKMLDWFFLQRHGSFLAGVIGAFKDFVLAQGARFTRCRM
jgi:hypothetical protein